MKISIILLLVVLFSSCSTAPKKEISDKKAKLYYQHGTANLVEKKYKEALSNLLQAAQIEPKNTMIQNNLGMAYYFNKAPIRAIQHIQKALTIDKTNPDARNNLASIYTEQGKYLLAEREYQTILKNLTYQQFRTYYNLGVIYYKKNSLYKAREFFNKSIKENPSYCSAHFQLGSLAEETKHYSQAAKHYRASTMGTCYYNPIPHYHRALMHIKAKEYDKAKSTLQTIITKFPSTLYGIKAQKKLALVNRLDSVGSSITNNNIKKYKTPKF